jgi:hypothetical protein
MKTGDKMYTPDIEGMAAELTRLVTETCVEPDADFVLICRLHENDGDLHVVLSPAPTEIYGGAHDGKTVSPGFNLDVLALSKLFLEITSLEWNPYPADSEESPYLMLEGSFEFIDEDGIAGAYEVAVEICSCPIEGDEAETQTHFRVFNSTTPNS